MCGGGGDLFGGGGGLLGALAGAGLAYMTGGASLALSGADAAAAGAGMLAGNQLIDKPQALAKSALEEQKKANEQALASYKKQADLADQANNKANAKTADVSSMMDANLLNSKGGQSGTMLTGPNRRGSCITAIG